MCPPNTLFGETGHLRKHQKNIQHLSIITDGQCALNHLVGYVKELPRMVPGDHTRLRSFSWTCIRSGNDLVGLSSILRESYNRLESLTLDINPLDWDQVRQFWSENHELPNHEEHWESNRFAVYVLNLHPGSSRVLFPFLKSLRLAYARFNDMASELLQAFNFNALGRLCLQNCCNVDGLLTRFADSQQIARLTTFEFTSDSLHQLHGSERVSAANALCHFLRAFAGLKHLYIYFDNPSDWLSIAYSLGRHKATLQDLVLHGLGMSHDAVDKYDVYWQKIMEEVLTCDHLISIGLNMSPSFLVSIHFLLTTSD